MCLIIKNKKCGQRWQVETVNAISTAKYCPCPDYPIIAIIKKSHFENQNLNARKTVLPDNNMVNEFNTDNRARFFDLFGNPRVIRAWF